MPATTSSATEPRGYFAYADAVGRGHGHVVQAESFEEAAVAYVEIYAPPVDGEDEVRIFVRDPDDGAEHCFTIDLGHGGTPEPCA